MSRYDHKIETSLEGIEHCDNLLAVGFPFNIPNKNTSTSQKMPDSIKDYFFFSVSTL